MSDEIAAQNLTDMLTQFIAETYDGVALGHFVLLAYAPGIASAEDDLYVAHTGMTQPPHATTGLLAMAPDLLGGDEATA